MAYLTPAAQEEKLLENPVLFQTPIVRNGKAGINGRIVNNPCLPSFRLHLLSAFPCQIPSFFL
jgi:hypothetical protein